MVAIGLDVHSLIVTACAVPVFESDLEEVEICMEFNSKFSRMKSNQAGLTQMAAFLSGKEHCILMENSTKTHEIYWILVNLGCTVMVAYSTDLYRITKSVKKTDEHDCVELAHYMRRKLLGEEEFSVCLIVDEKTMNRRQMCRIYNDESESLSDIRRQIRSFMLLRGINPIEATRDIVSEKSLRSLEMTQNDTLKLLLERARSCKERLRKCEAAIGKEFRDDIIYNILLSVPGFGPITSAYVSSMIMDIKRFDGQKQFSAYFGLVPKQRESGGSSEKCGITRRGDCVLRKMILHATFIHIKCDKDRVSSVSETYDRLRNRGFPHKKALMASANRMTKVIYAMLTSGEKYRL